MDAETIAGKLEDNEQVKVFQNNVMSYSQVIAMAKSF